MHRVMSDPEAQQLPTHEEIVGTLGCPDSAAVGSTGLPEKEGRPPIRAIASAPPVVDRTAAHPHHFSAAKALVKSDSGQSSQPLRSGPSDGSGWASFLIHLCCGGFPAGLICLVLSDGCSFGGSIERQLSCSAMRKECLGL